MGDEKKGRKKQARSNKQTNKAKQHSTPKAVTFPKINELPQVGLKPTTLYTVDRALYHMYIHYYNYMTVSSMYGCIKCSVFACRYTMS